jgi:hypothetical protein
MTMPGGGADVTTLLQPPPVSNGAPSRAPSRAPARPIGAAIAVAAALLFNTVAVSVASAAEPAKIKCQGVNACKGTSACATAHSACQGLNDCKGQGFLMLSKADCDAAQAKLAPR